MPTMSKQNVTMILFMQGCKPAGVVTRAQSAMTGELRLSSETPLSYRRNERDLTTS